MIYYIKFNNFTESLQCSPMFLTSKDRCHVHLGFCFFWGGRFVFDFFSKACLPCHISIQVIIASGEWPPYLWIHRLGLQEPPMQSLQRWGKQVPLSSAEPVDLCPWPLLGSVWTLEHKTLDFSFHGETGCGIFNGKLVRSSVGEVLEQFQQTTKT